MLHIDEHTLELYVLGAKEAAPRSVEIERHLAECPACRRLAETMRKFYADARTANQTIAPQDHALVYSGRNAAPPALYQPVPVALRPENAPQRFWRFARKHPFVTGGGGIALAAGLTLGILTLVRFSPKDTNPASYYMNEGQGTLEVFNKHDEKLWSMPVARVGDYANEELAGGQKYTQIVDLNGDGENEIITTLPLAGSRESGQSSLRILRGDKSELFKVRLGEPMAYGDRIYTGDYNTTCFTVGDYSGSGKKEIIVAACNDHSPCILSRFDGNGHRLGTYRHFGHLLQILDFDINKDGFNEVLLMGISDAGEDGKSKSVLVVLDPRRILGDGESSFAGGFGLPPSAAESYYVQVPRDEIALARNVEMQFILPRVVYLQGGRGFRVVLAGTTGAGIPNFEYIFSSDMKVLEVKSADNTKQVFDELARQGKVRGDFYGEYLKRLRGKILYWTGKAWTSDPTPILH